MLAACLPLLYFAFAAAIACAYHRQTNHHLTAAKGSALLSAIMSAPPSLPSKPCLSLDIAKTVADACRAEAQRHNWTVVISIVDDGGNLMYLEKMDSTQLGSIAVSQDKAVSALLFKRPTKVFSDMVLDKGSVNMMALRNAIAVEGGVPLFIDKVIVGAIGISGVTSTQDGQIAAAGAAHFNSLYGSVL